MFLSTKDEKMLRALSVGLLMVYDVLAVIGAFCIALILRFDELRLEYIFEHTHSAPLVLATYLLTFYAFRLYRYRWLYAGVEVVWSVLLANIFATSLATVWQLMLDNAHLPRSVIIMTCVLATAMIGGQRLMMRLATQYVARSRREKASFPEQEPKRAVILGNERSAVEVLNAITHESASRYEVIGILDPDPQHRGMFVRGIKVLGGWELAHALMRQHAVDEVIIAQHCGSGLELREYVLACCRHKIAVRMVPVTIEWLENPSASRRELRIENIRAEDLLHRKPLEVSPQELGNYLHGKRVLVTGAGGSIGSELCRQISQHNPSLLVILGHGENSIHQITLELQRLYPRLAASTVSIICDIRDEAHLSRIIEHFHPQVLFHAAAHKHVPLMEDNVSEAIDNNVRGTRNVIRMASRHGIERMVLISTDKAVNPSSVMGATKFLCEEMASHEATRSATAFITVRFGNVLGSRGSVLPRFMEQISYGGPLTVTHPEMRRFFMTIPEAVSLVLQAGSIGHSGELFVLDMGRPVRIVNLAEDLIRLSGLVPYHDIKIEFCGLRPGEKLTEELFTEDEQRVASAQEGLFTVRRPHYIPHELLDMVINELLRVAEEHDNAKALALLHEKIATFHEANDSSVTKMKAA